MTRRRANNEGSIRKRSDGRWEVRISLPNGKRRSYYAKTQREALHRKADAISAMTRGQPITDDQVSVAVFLESWLRDSAAPKVRPATFASYESKIRRHLIPALGRIQLAKLTPQHVERMMRDQLAQGVPPQSVAHHRSVLRNALSTAERWGVVPRNAAKLARPPSVPEREFRSLGIADAHAILSAVQGDRLGPLFALTLAVGLRKSEALGLQWRDMDFEAATLRIERSLQRTNHAYTFAPVKTRRSRRHVPLPAPVVAILREQRARQLRERRQAGAGWEGEAWGDLVFGTEIGGPLSGFTVTRRFHQLLRAAGLPDRRFHDLRHGTASLLAALGINTRDTMDLLGHADPATTIGVYTHTTPDLQREAAIRMGEALWPSAPQADLVGVKTGVNE